jgi:hypothetical protein
MKSNLACRVTGFFLFYLFFAFQTAYGFLNFGTLTSANQNLCGPADPTLITFSVLPSGAPTFTYNWFYKEGIVAAPTGSNPNGWTIISGATSSSYNPPAGLERSRTYACFVTGPNAIRNWATGARQIRVYHNGDIGTTYQPFLITGDPIPVSFSTSPSGPTGMTFSYQWYFKNGIVSAPIGSSTSGWTLISGASSSTYDPPGGLTTARSYACFVSPSNSLSCLGNKWAKGVKHAMVYPILNGTITTSQNLYCSPADPLPFTFSLLPSFGSTFQWYYQDGLSVLNSGLDMEAPLTNWTLIPGATDLTYDPPAGLTNSRGYACRVTNGIYSLWTNGLQIRVSNTVTGVISSQQTGCASFNPAPIVFSSAPVGSDYYWLNWYYVENPNAACPSTSEFVASNWTSLPTAGPFAANVMTGQFHDPTTSGPNGRTYILRISPALNPSCETPYVTNCHRIFVNPCRESVDGDNEADEKPNTMAYLGDVFPNPGTNGGEVELRLPKGQSRGMFLVRSVDGKLVYQKEIFGDQTQVLHPDRSQWPSGLYFYSLEALGMAPLVKKWMVQQ